MAVKKKRVEMYCQICQKNTTHEVGTGEEPERYVCLRCKGAQISAENAALKYENQIRTEKYMLDQIIEAERSRTHSPGG